jgi:hypothetical protein
VRFKELQKNNGVEFGLVYKPGSNTDIFGYVRYIVPGSDAATKDIQRGAIFTVSTEPNLRKQLPIFISK